MVSLRVRRCLCIVPMLGIWSPTVWAECPDCQYEKCSLFGLGCKCVPRAGCTIAAPITGITPKDNSTGPAPAAAPEPPPPQIKKQPDHEGNGASVPVARDAAKGALPGRGSVESYDCAGKGFHRTVTITSTGSRCEAAYKAERGAPQVIWRSGHEPASCAAKATAFIARLRSQNIHCTAR